MSALDSLEAKWRMEKDFRDPNYYTSSYFSWYSYGTGFASEILENIQVTISAINQATGKQSTNFQLNIKDIHIRYEDSCSIPGKSVAFGITIDSITSQNCDSNWTPRGNQCSHESHSFELLELDAFATYWTMFQTGESYVNKSVAELVVSILKHQSFKYIISDIYSEFAIDKNLFFKMLL